MDHNNLDDILARLDEIKKLQTELRHLVPQVASSSSRDIGHPQDLTSDTSIRFPSLFTFPVVSSLDPTSSKSERVQKSTARLNLSGKLSPSDRRPSIAYLPKARSSVRETSAFWDSSRAVNDVVATKSRSRNIPNASTSAMNSTTPYLTRSNTVSRAAKQGAIKGGVKNTDKTPRAIVERSIAPKNGNNSNAKIRTKAQNCVILLRNSTACMTPIFASSPRLHGTIVCADVERASLRGKGSGIARNTVVPKKKSSS
ncbi:PREDICTED: uncharacterized protein LOC106746170 [Dinoponera quadriceps]|uniref:Uncharacterized protein LOC106746170 n=1 Tax=Dinoponera quadriceps TaxID=609295 RepID=A0A6P3XIW0_DINQU|nr:PREDICTED: uncharacterized protein LOC106746170 [Dinoponera quadriceps]